MLRLYTHHSEICFDYLVTGRDIPLSGISQAIEPFFNLLCCRLNLYDTMTFFDTLEAAHGDIIGSVRYQDFSR